MGGGAPSQNTTTSTAPWAGQQPYLKQGFEEAKSLYDKGPAEYFPGATYVPMSGQTQAGLNSQMNTAINKNNNVEDAAGVNWKTLSGQYLSPNSNPYLKDTYNAAAGRLNEDFSENTLPSIGGMFGTQGGVGNSSFALAAGDAAGDLTRSKSDLAANIYGGNYQAERGRQQEAVGMAPAIRQAQYGDASKMQEVGKAYEDFGARQLEDQINRWNYKENAPMASLQDYLAMISGNYGSTSTSRQSSSGGSGLATGAGALGLLGSLLGGM